MEKITVKISGMHCAGCVRSVEKSIEKIDDVQSVNVNLAAETATIEFKNGKLPVERIREAVENAGYRLLTAEHKSKDKLAEKREHEENKLKTARKNLLLSWIITVPVMVWMGLEMFFSIHLTSPLVMESFLTVGAAVVLFIPGRDTLVSAWKSGRHLNPNMDVLIALGTLASLGTGVLALFHHLEIIEFPMHSFAGIAAMIMAFHLTGRYIETKSRGRASDAIMKLLTLEADKARVVRNGLETEIPAGELLKGDIMIVRPGEKIPTDGEVIDGEGSVDEAMVTGESMPERKEKGDEVIGGTINLEGSLRVKAVHIGEDTFLNRVVKLVEEAQGTKVPIQEYADRITAVFVPVVLLLALTTFLIWVLFPELFVPVLNSAEGILPWVEPGMGIWSQAFYASLAVLVIACPCALGLATPTALMIGSGMGAENGILIRRGEAIQRLQEVTEFVFDKTGTLTTGEPSVTDMELTGDMSEAEFLELLYGVENRSEHPISIAVSQYATKKDIPLTDIKGFSSHPGMGVTGIVKGKKITAGNRRLMNQKEIELPDHVSESITQFEQEGKTVVITAIDDNVQGIMAVADRIKPGTIEVIEKLKKTGYKTAILTGDNQAVAEAIAAQLGIDRVFAEVLPDQKAGIIRKQQESGEVVAMVGDGVNDAPALTQADVGIAIGTGTDIAIESGSVVLIEGNLSAVLKAVNLSRETFRKIRQNLFWAYFYNVVMIPVAIIGLMHPVLAEAAMAFSSINVVVNSRRLQKKELSS
jgi:P-type Cu+ transporter